MADTFIDGIGLERCSTCKRVLQAPDGRPRVLVTIEDCEEVLCFLTEYVDLPEVWGETIARLERAVGQTFAQIKERERCKRLSMEVSTS